METKQIRLFVSFLATFLLFISMTAGVMGAEMTREKAGELIRRNLGPLKYEKGWDRIYLTSESPHSYVGKGDYANTINQMVKDGLMELKAPGKTNIKGNDFILTLTAKGKQYARSGGTTYYNGLTIDEYFTLTLAEYGFKGVTGIKKPDKNTMVVEYSLEIIKTTPFTKYFPQEMPYINRGLGPHSATFVLYDDGWRLSR